MDLLLWQLADSAFPAGGFAHSAGLEAAMQHREVTCRDDLEAFTCAVIRQAGYSALPLVTAAHANPRGLVELDALCDAFLSNPVANRASRTQGRACLTACARSFPGRARSSNHGYRAGFRLQAPDYRPGHANTAGCQPPAAGSVARLGLKSEARSPKPIGEPGPYGFVVAIEALHHRVDRAELRGHYAPLFGAALSALGVDRRSTQQLFLFLTGRTVTSAAVRLGLVGTYEAQQVQAAMATEIDRTIERCADLRPCEIAHTAPLIDLFQSTHDRLYSRLFQS